MSYAGEGLYMNYIDMILQSADLPELPVEAISDERQASILNGALQLVRQDAKKRSRRHMVRIVAAAAAAVAVLCGAAAILHYASVSNEEGTYHAEGVVIRTDGTPNPYSFDFSHDADLGRAQQMLDTAASQQVSRVLFVAGTLENAEAAELAACSSTYEATSTFMAENKSVQNIVHALSSLAEYAALRGVTITLEDFDGFLQPFARTYPLLWFMEHVPGLRYTLDIGNFAFSDEDVSYAAWLLKDYIVHVHCKDRAESPLVHGRFCRGLGQTPAGTGYLPMARLLTDLEAHDYDGYLAIEHFDAPDQEKCIQRSAAFLRDNFQ